MPRENDSSGVDIVSRLSNIQNQLDSLNKLVITGNGQPPLLGRVLLIEKEIGQIGSQMRAMLEQAEQRTVRLQAAENNLVVLLDKIKTITDSMDELDENTEEKFKAINLAKTQIDANKNEMVKKIVLLVLGAIFSFLVSYSTNLHLSFEPPAAHPTPAIPK